MTFGEELCMVSNDISLEERVFEAIKPYLTEIASVNHPKGCHVVIEGATESFTDKLKKVMKKEDIYFKYIYRDPKFGGPNYGDIIWEKCTFKNGEFTVYCGISNQLLRVELGKLGQFSISIEKLGKEYKDSYFHRYIS